MTCNLQEIIIPLLQTLESTKMRLGDAEAANNVELSKLLLSNILLICKIFFSLNSPGLTEVRCQLDPVPSKVPLEMYLVSQRFTVKRVPTGSLACLRGSAVAMSWFPGTASAIQASRVDSKGVERLLDSWEEFEVCEPW